MIIKREQYIEALLNKRWNGKVKIITGIRRCGKSFLLSTLLPMEITKQIHKKMLSCCHFL